MDPILKRFFSTIRTKGYITFDDLIAFYGTFKSQPRDYAIYEAINELQEKEHIYLEPKNLLMKWQDRANIIHMLTSFSKEERNDPDMFSKITSERVELLAYELKVHYSYMLGVVKFLQKLVKYLVKIFYQNG